MSKFGIAENVVQLLKRITKQLKRKPVWVKPQAEPNTTIQIF